MLKLFSLSNAKFAAFCFPFFFFGWVGWCLFSWVSLGDYFLFLMRCGVILIFCRSAGGDRIRVRGVAAAGIWRWDGWILGDLVGFFVGIRWFVFVSPKPFCVFFSGSFSCKSMGIRGFQDESELKKPELRCFLVFLGGNFLSWWFFFSFYLEEAGAKSEPRRICAKNLHSISCSWVLLADLQDAWSEEFRR